MVFWSICNINKHSLRKRVMQIGEHISHFAICWNLKVFNEYWITMRWKKVKFPIHCDTIPVSFEKRKWCSYVGTMPACLQITPHRFFYNQCVEITKKYKTCLLSKIEEHFSLLRLISPSFWSGKQYSKKKNKP